MRSFPSIAFSFVATLAIASAAVGAESKETICHRPPGNAKPVTIVVASSAVPAHIKHGDSLGACATACVSNASCDDGDACTNDTCLSDGRCDHSAVVCADTNVCTADSCNPATGCVHAAVAGCCLSNSECSDANACTTDVCVSNSCTSVSIDCDDQDACTNDSCNPSTGCTHSPSTADACFPPPPPPPNCAPGTTFCDPACVDLENDRNNCGECGYQCSAQSAGCAFGACLPAACTGDADCQDGYRCAEGATGGVCIPLGG